MQSEIISKIHAEGRIGLGTVGGSLDNASEKVVKGFAEYVVKKVKL